MELHTVRGQEADIKPNEPIVMEDYELDLDREGEKYAWRDLNLSGHFTEKSKATTILITKTMGLLLMAGFRPILGEGHHDEIVFGYEVPVKSANTPAYHTISLPIRGAMVNPHNFTQLLADIDRTIGFNIANPDKDAPLEDRFEQLDAMLLNKFEPFNDVKNVYTPHGSKVYNANFLNEMEQRFKTSAEAYRQEFPEKAETIGTFKDSVEHGNTDARILIGSHHPSLELAVQTRGFMAKITQAEMLSKPAIGMYVNTRDEDRNYEVDLAEFVSERLANLTKKAVRLNMEQTKRVVPTPEEEELLRKYLPNKKLINELTEDSASEK